MTKTIDRMCAQWLLLLPIVAAVGCDADDGPTGDATEIITTVRLRFTPAAGTAIEAAFRDPDGDGGMPPTIDAIALAPMQTYDLAVEFANELVMPAEDITAEIEGEAAAHQVFLLGSAVDGPATDNPGAALMHAYADTEADYGAGGTLPVGLVNTITTAAQGQGDLIVMLRHMPALNGTAQKHAGLAESLAMGEPLPGEVDAQVTFAVTVP